MEKHLYKIIDTNNKYNEIKDIEKLYENIETNKDIRDLPEKIKKAFLKNHSIEKLKNIGYSITKDALLKSLRKIILIKNKLEEIVKYENKPLEIYDLLEIYITIFFDEFNRLTRIVKNELKIEDKDYIPAINEIRNHLVHSYNKEDNKQKYFCDVSNIGYVIIIDKIKKNEKDDNKILIFNLKGFFRYIQEISNKIIKYK